MNKKILIIPCLILASCQNNNAESISTGKEKAQVVMLIGQSNASGVAWNKYLANYVDSETIIQYTFGIDKVKIAHQCEGYAGNKSPEGEFVNVKVGQGYNLEHFGPALGMADYLSKNYGKNVYIIKWAYGGTGLATDWKSPSFSGGNNGWCYDGFVSFAKDSIKALTQNYRVEVKAFCWMQGEEDSVHDYILGMIDSVLDRMVGQAIENVDPDDIDYEALAEQVKKIFPIEAVGGRIVRGKSKGEPGQLCT